MRADTMDLNSLFASYKGRLNLKPLWIAIAAIYGLSTLAAFAVYYTAVHYRAFNIYEFQLLISCLFSVQFFLMAPLIVKRLHDRNRSGWWTLAVWVAPHAYLLYGSHFVNALSGTISGIEAIVSFVLVCIGAWAVFDLLLIRGTLGENRFGADPLPVRFRAELRNGDPRRHGALHTQSGAMSKSFSLVQKLDARFQAAALQPLQSQL